MSKQPYHQKKTNKLHHLAKYTSTQAAEWRKLLKENNWRYPELEAHLGLPPKTVGKVFIKDNAGELPT